MCACVNDVRALDFATYHRHRLHDRDIDALRLSKKTIGYMYVVVVACTYMLLFLVTSPSLSLTTHRYIQRGLYNQSKKKIGLLVAYNVHIFFRILFIFIEFSFFV